MIKRTEWEMVSRRRMFSFLGLAVVVGSRPSTHRRRGANLRHGAPPRAARRARRTALRATRRHACIKTAGNKRASGTNPACDTKTVVQGSGAAFNWHPFCGRSKLYPLPIERAQARLVHSGSVGSNLERSIRA